MKSYLVVFLIFFSSKGLLGQMSFSDLDQESKALYLEHVYGGQPDDDSVLVRNAYVANYDSELRIPNWCAYHITKDYLNTPTRTNRFKKFREDPDVADPVSDDDYDGLFDSLGYARGHLAPYKILGGDRDDDGRYAALDGDSDVDDDLTVFQGNYMSNIAPQLHNGFNGSGGLWFKTERWVQDKVVSESVDVWEFSGGLVIDDRFIETVGPNNDIAVPDLYYKVVIKEDSNGQPEVLVFLFPHSDNKDDIEERDIFQFLVSVDYLEAISGLDFFNSFSKEEQSKIEANIDLSGWTQYMQ